VRDEDALRLGEIQLHADALRIVEEELGIAGAWHELRRRHVQPLASVFADPMQLAPAAWTALALEVDDDLDPRQTRKSAYHQEDGPRTPLSTNAHCCGDSVAKVPKRRATEFPPNDKTSGNCRSM
jgi:hypothetical protein